MVSSRKCPLFSATMFVIVVTQLLAIAASPRAAAEEVKVMSFNVRYSRAGLGEAKTENNWADSTRPRRERAVRVIREYMPDLLGVQEARHLQVVDLRKSFPEYDFYGIGRDDGKKQGEYAGIFYLKDRFERVDAGSFWLSATPEKPSTSFYTAPGAVPRIASWVRLRDKAAQCEMLVLNAHWDHISDDARRKSAGLMRERLQKLGDGLPAIVMGDFNTYEDSPAVVELIGATDSTSPRLIDAYRKLHPKRSNDESTFNSWAGDTAGSRIDFILCTDDFNLLAATIVRTSYDGLWSSDHYPVTATLDYSSKHGRQ